jgi:uncharacterized protein involved in exopolysaccharide biosynthesis
MVLLGAVLGGLVALTAIMLYGRRYEARMTLAAVGNPKLATLEGGLASSLLGSGLGLGLNATPALIVQLAQLDGVLYPVAESHLDSTRAERIIDRVAGKRAYDLDPSEVVKKMKKVVWVSFDRQTGLITLEVVHRDSALARQLATRLVAATSNAFVRAARAQATELRRAQETRVDSAERRLRLAEQRLVEFNRENRAISDYSPAYLDRQRLERDVSISRTVYTQAVTDREAAVAKELEATPSVVVVDPIPQQLPTVPRYVLLLTILGVLLGAALTSLVVVVREKVAVHES